MTEPWGFMPSCAAEFPNDNPALHDGASWVCLRISGPPRPVTRPRATATDRAVAAPLELTPAVSLHSEAASDVASVEAPLMVSAEPVVEPVVDSAAVEDLLPESVLSALLQTLDLELTPSASESVGTTESIEAAETAFDAPLADSTDVQASLELDATAMSESEPSSAVFAFDAEGEPAGSESHQQTLEAPANEISVATVDPEPAAPDAFSALVAALVDVALSAGATRAAAVLPDLLERGTLEAGAFSDDTREGLLAARIVNGASAPTETFLSTASAWRQVLRGESSDFSGCGTSTLDEWATALLKGFGVGQNGKLDTRRELRRRGVAAFGMLLAA